MVCATAGRAREIPLSRICKPLGQEHAEGMTDGDFLDWVKSTLYEAERALLKARPAEERSDGPNGLAAGPTERDLLSLRQARCGTRSPGAGPGWPAR